MTGWALAALLAAVYLLGAWGALVLRGLIGDMTSRRENREASEAAERWSELLPPGRS